MKVSQLRDLTRKFASGGMPEEDYRRERGKLIDAIVNGDVSIKYRDIRPTNRPQATPKVDRRKLIMLSVGVLLIAMLAISLLIQLTSQPAEEPAEIVIKEQPGVELLRGFVEADRWDEPTLENLESNWQELTGFERETARQSLWYRRLKSQAESRIKEYEALGTPEGLMQAARLRVFAERMDFMPGS
ncbi:MAG: hypothetical protein R3217_02340 [Gammaproteobacteria bacterium]|nr:hypothetical protein [Gammaproteobacteria bacterium]